MGTWQMQEAKAKISELVKSAQSERVDNCIKKHCLL